MSAEARVLAHQFGAAAVTNLQHNVAEDRARGEMVECPHCGKLVPFIKGGFNICVAPDLLVDASQ